MRTSRLARDLTLVVFAALALGVPVPLPVAALALATAAALALAADRSVVEFATLDEARRRRLADSRRKWLNLFILVTLPAVVTLTTAPSLSSDATLPDVSGLKPFSAECNFMSREGYLMYLARRNGYEMSRAEARRIIRSGGGRSVRAARRDAGDDREVRYAERRARVLNRGGAEAAGAARVDGAARTRLERLRDEYRLRAAGRYASADARSTRALEASYERIAGPTPRAYRGRRVAVLPFPNVGTKKNPGGRVEEAIARELSARGYEVVAVPHDLYHQALEEGMGREEMRRFCDRYGVDHVVAGRVTKYSPYKKVRLAGLVLGGILTGWHGYGDVALEGGVYHRADDAFDAQRVSERSKKEVLGAFSGTRDLLDASLRRAAARFVGSM